MFMLSKSEVCYIKEATTLLLSCFCFQVHNKQKSRKQVSEGKNGGYSGAVSRLNPEQVLRCTGMVREHWIVMCLFWIKGRIIGAWRHYVVSLSSRPWTSCGSRDCRGVQG